MKRFVVMHDYHDEGWKIVGQYATILEAVLAREDDLSSGSGACHIFEWHSPLAAYRDAHRR